MVLALGLTLLSLPAHASLVSLDWQTAGDGGVTLDNQTGLEWLDWSLTVNMSYNAVSAQLGAGGTYQGFRYATLSELQTLYTNAGFVYPTSSDPANIPAAQNFTSFFGITFGSSAPSNGGTEAIFDHSSSSGNHWVTAVNHSSGLVRPEWFELNDSLSLNYAGSALVRPHVSQVPVPAAGLLLGFGLAAFGLVGRRRRRQN